MRLPTGSVGGQSCSKGPNIFTLQEYGMQAYYNLHYTDKLPITPGELPLLCQIILDFSPLTFDYEFYGNPIIMQTQTSIRTDQ